jgi:hypothetical protein
MHAYKVKCVLRLLGPKYDQGPLALLKELLLLSGCFKALLLRFLALRTVYRTTQVHTSKQMQKIINSTPNNVNRAK